MVHSVELVFDSHDPAAVRKLLDRAIRRTSGSFQTTERRGEACVILTGARDDLVEYLHKKALRSPMIDRLVTGIVLRRRE